MGIYRNSGELVDRVLTKLGLYARPPVETEITPDGEAASKVISETIWSECERFPYPFALRTLLLSNPETDTLITGPSTTERKIYQKPEDSADIIGVFTENDIPTVFDIVQDPRIKDSSLDYYPIGGNRIAVSYGGSEQLYFLYVTGEPQVADMSTAFQLFLVFWACGVLYDDVGSNSRIQARYFYTAEMRKKEAQKSALLNSGKVIPPLTDLNNLLLGAGPDGKVPV